MSGVEALSLATGVMTVITFAAQTAQVCLALYKGIPTANEDMREKAGHMMDATAVMDDHFKSLSHRRTTEQEKRLMEISKKCHTVAADLQMEVDAIGVSQAQKNFFKSVKGAFKSHLGKSKMEKLEKKLKDYEETLQTQILVRICSQSEAKELLHTKNFELLHEDVKHFITQTAAGFKDIADLCQALQSETTEITTKKVQLTGNMIKDHITQENKTQAKLKISEEQRRRLLKSLKFSGMNARSNEIHESHEHTFRWVLEPGYGYEDDTEYSSSLAPDDTWETESSCPSSDEATDVILDEEGNKDDNAYSNDSQNTHPLRHDQNWPDFVEWLESGNQMYWISGKPGSGKSTLMKFLVSNKRTHHALQKWKENTAIFFHYFWKVGGGLQNNCKGFWCALAYQRLSNNNSHLDHMLQTFPELREKDEVSDWSSSEVRTVCLEALARDSSSFCIFVDGLDEIAYSDGINAVKNAFAAITTKLGSNIKFCVSSRDEIRFRSWLDGTPELPLHLLTENDMRLILEDKLIKPFLGQRESASLHKISNILLEKAQGVFMWLVLALRSTIDGLENIDSNAEIEKRIEQLPEELDDLYDEMWQRLAQGDRIYQEKAAKTLNLIIFFLLFQPGRDDIPVFMLLVMTTPELRDEFYRGRADLVLWDLEKVKMHSGLIEKDICKYCAGFLEVFAKPKKFNVKRPRVQFIHRTAFDYLLTTSNGQRILLSANSSSEVMKTSVVKGILGWEVARGLNSRWSSISELHFMLITLMGSDLVKNNLELADKTLKICVEFIEVLKLSHPRCERSEHVSYSFLWNLFRQGVQWQRDLYLNHLQLFGDTSTVATFLLVAISGTITPNYASWDENYWITVPRLVALGADPQRSLWFHVLDPWSSLGPRALWQSAIASCLGICYNDMEVHRDFIRHGQKNILGCLLENEEEIRGDMLLTRRLFTQSWQPAIPNPDLIGVNDGGKNLPKTFSSILEVSLHFKVGLTCVLHGLLSDSKFQLEAGTLEKLNDLYRKSSKRPGRLICVHIYGFEKNDPRPKSVFYRVRDSWGSAHVTNATDLWDIPPVYDMDRTVSDVERMIGKGLKLGVIEEWESSFDALMREESVPMRFDPIHM